MRTTTEHLTINYGTPNQSEDGNRYRIIISEAQTGKVLFEYYGPVYLMNQSDLYRVLGQSIVHEIQIMHERG